MTRTRFIICLVILAIGFIAAVLWTRYARKQEYYEYKTVTIDGKTYKTSDTEYVKRDGERLKIILPNGDEIATTTYTLTK